MNTQVSDVAKGPQTAFAWRKGLAVAVPLIGIAVIGVSLTGKAPAEAPPPLPTVAVAQPLQREVEQWDQYIGRFAPSQSVEVRPRVGGAITAIHFRDGQTVRPGDLLFTVDQRPYRTALAEAQAGVASARSALALARSDYQRAGRLAGDDAIAANEVDSLRSRVNASEAALAAAQARATARALDLGFTQVRAPIGGRISNRRIDIGNLVTGGDNGSATLLTTINAMDPIYFTFDAAESLYLKTHRQRQGAETPVEIRLQDESAYRWKGKLDFTDNSLDTRSGTIRGRAVVANPQGLLTPGLFGDMHMSAGKARALLVPDEAIVTDQASKLVYVVGADGVVAGRTVTLGPVTDGLRVITKGLSPADRVIVGGLSLAVPGTKVNARPGRIVPQANVLSAAAPTAPAAGEATLAAR
jgi:RND family efflux transporter MFP subunit